ncbi:hypothetical protein RV16_GL000718 [Enterococcus saccharolyticus]|uniref:hypothetical protein n=1 Tax=Enterococcus saccharolyticus TaxID=41997 RepID=UPI0003A5D217|nr:hypothetical protein [Enterococcus saccharolyticus]OJG87436.1 hypothetical protein RV16_GL000718 [Enterococcus saccharolyticus]
MTILLSLRYCGVRVYCLILYYTESKEKEVRTMIAIQTAIFFMLTIGLLVGLNENN